MTRYNCVDTQGYWIGWIMPELTWEMAVKRADKIITQERSGPLYRYLYIGFYLSDEKLLDKEMLLWNHRGDPIDPDIEDFKKAIEQWTTKDHDLIPTMKVHLRP